METNRTKFLTKDYLAEQFYNYNKKYIIDDVKKNKQDNLEITSRHITWEDTHKLGLNISNDEDAKPYDYLILEPWEENDYYEDETGKKIYGQGKLRWDSPIDDQSKIVNGSKFLVNGNALHNWLGSRNITTLGEITSGVWKVGRIELYSGQSGSNSTYEKIGNFKIEFLNDKANNLVITGDYDNTVAKSALVVIEPDTEINGETKINNKTIISPKEGKDGADLFTVKGDEVVSGKITVGADATTGTSDTDSKVNGKLTVSKLTVSNSMNVNCDAKIAGNVTINKGLNLGANNTAFIVTADGSVMAQSVSATSANISELSTNTIKLSGAKESTGDNGTEYKSNAINIQNNVSFKDGKIFLESGTDIVVVAGGGTTFNQPITVNGNLLQLASNSDVLVESWISEIA